MFKFAISKTSADFKVAKNLMQRIYDENPSYWPYGLHADGFDGGLYLIREKRSHVPAGFVGWQERVEKDDTGRRVKTGYYSIGVLPEFRRNGYAKQAVSKILAMKSASVDRVRALISQHNTPSLELAQKLNIPIRVKSASSNADLSVIPGLLRPWA